MLGLKLREEFRGRRLRGTAIELANSNQTGATQVAAADFLTITYPSTDTLKLLEAAGPDHGRPIVLEGERGQGKSHLMAALYHSLTDVPATQAWLNHWADTLGNPRIARIPLRAGMHVISDSLHKQRHKFLWDLLFEKHPNGEYCQGKWDSLGDKKTDVPSDTILLEMFRHTPTVLILDEFQTWFDGLTNTKQHPWRHWAFNFIQLLSEIAKEHPELLVLVVSVRNGSTDAFQQIQRVNPVIIDFKGPDAKRDRSRLLLHRLFENRLQIGRAQIEGIIQTHISEFFRLKNTPPAEQQRIAGEFIDAWPYAIHLMQLLEDQVLIATNAQETRDLIKVLASLFKHHGEGTPLITAADFRLDDDESGITALLDSVSNQHHARLRDKAMRNLEAVRDAIPNAAERLPHLQGIIGSLWLRSLADINQAGADQATLHVDVTRDKPVDDNAFQVELAGIVENSFNIHESGNRYLFREAENPQARLLASARNDKLFLENEGATHLAKEIRYVLGGGSDVSNRFHVIVLPRNWRTDPWSQLPDPDQPNQWDDRIPMLVLPEAPTKIESLLGQWVCDHLQSRRNTPRFLLPRDGASNLFADQELIILARCVYLADQWRADNPEYGKLQQKYQKQLRDILKDRFDRYAILANWNFQKPQTCRFHIETHRAQGSQIPQAVDQQISENLFIPEDFQEFILAAANNNETVGKLLRELKEPRPGGQDCIPWLGETLAKEQIIRLCAQGRIAINLRGMEYMQRREGESDENAWRRMCGQLGTGKHLDETYILLPQNVPAAGGVAAPPLPPGATLPGFGASPTPTPAPGQPPQPPSNPPGSIFGASGVRVPINIPATSALNLLGRIESQGIKPGTQLHDLQLKVSRLTGAQLQELVKKLPDGMVYELGIQKEQSE